MVLETMSKSITQFLRTVLELRVNVCSELVCVGSCSSHCVHGQIKSQALTKSQHSRDKTAYSLVRSEWSLMKLLIVHLGKHRSALA